MRLRSEPWPLLPNLDAHGAREPSTMRIAASIVSQFKSFTLLSDLPTCAWSRLPTLSRPGAFDPLRASPPS